MLRPVGLALRAAALPLFKETFAKVARRLVGAVIGRVNQSESSDIPLLFKEGNRLARQFILDRAYNSNPRFAKVSFLRGE
jgi:hypothetical protein